MFESLTSVYKERRVLLTGHTGFKGAWLLQWLHLLGAEVMGYALPPATDEDLYQLIDGEQLCHSVIGDINDLRQLEETLLSFQPDFVFHLAAQPLVRLSYDIPSETFATNAIGTAYLLDALRKLQKRCNVVLITTDKVYENKEWIYPYRETDTLGGFDPYSASKACAELVIQSYVHSFFHPQKFDIHQKAIASTRAGNVIGGGDWSKDRIVPDIVRALRQHKPIIVRNPVAVRPWQHVLEPLGGYLLLGAKLALEGVSFNGAWNFGPQADDNKQVQDLVKTAINVWGDGSFETPQIEDQPHEATLLKLDISKAITQLGWRPRYNAQEAITETIEWYKTYQNHAEEIKAFTIGQISSYTGFNEHKELAKFKREEDLKTFFSA